MPHPRLAAVVLAAGRSSRMGAFKPLLPLAGKPLLQHVLDMLHAVGGLAPVIVVIGHNADALTPLLAAAPPSVSAIHNPDYAAGEMLSSVQTAVRRLPPDVDAFILALADQPAVQPATLRSLIDAWSTARPALAIPRYRMKRGHPLLISSSLRDEILALPPGDTLRTVTHRHRSTAIQVDVDDPAVIADLDTPAELQAAQRRHS